MTLPNSSLSTFPDLSKSASCKTGTCHTTTASLSHVLRNLGRARRVLAPLAFNRTRHGKPGRRSSRLHEPARWTRYSPRTNADGRPCSPAPLQQTSSPSEAASYPVLTSGQTETVCRHEAPTEHSGPRLETVEGHLLRLKQT